MPGALRELRFGNRSWRNATGHEALSQLKNCIVQGHDLASLILCQVNATLLEIEEKQLSNVIVQRARRHYVLVPQHRPKTFVQLRVGVQPVVRLLVAVIHQCYIDSNLSTMPLMAMQAFSADCEYEALGWAIRMNSARSATLQRQSDISSNTSTMGLLLLLEPVSSISRSVSASARCCKM
jgi:hypothetical protein